MPIGELDENAQAPPWLPAIQDRLDDVRSEVAALAQPAGVGVGDANRAARTVP
jgi:hypothetical protein